MNKVILSFRPNAITTTGDKPAAFVAPSNLALFTRATPTPYFSSPMKKLHLACLLALIAALTICGFQNAQAVTRTWDGGGSNANWDTVNNWDNNATPATTDDITFASGFTSGTSINLNGNRTVNTLTISTTTDFSITNSTLTITAGTLTRSAASGTTTINSGIVLGTAAAWNIWHFGC